MILASRILFCISLTASCSAFPRVKIPRAINQRVFKRCASTLEHTVDGYGGVTVDSTSLPSTKQQFVAQIQHSLTSWKTEGRRGVWLKIPASKIDFASEALNLGFVMHHAEKDYLMLTNWLTDEENKLPSNASHQVGIGCVAFNEEGKLLSVQEKTGGFQGIWKLPTGLVNAREDLNIACQREVMEETGIHTEFIGILSFRHMHNSLFGKSDLFFVCLMKPTSSEIMKEHTEIERCEWIDVEQYSTQPQILRNPVHATLARFIERVAVEKDKTSYLTQSICANGFKPGSSVLYLPPII
jgi:ADP-ribose pyrophosphatase YjhB (NUDIX family)